jgi:hypothetical protein
MWAAGLVKGPLGFVTLHFSCAKRAGEARHSLGESFTRGEQ